VEDGVAVVDRLTFTGTLTVLRPWSKKVTDPAHSCGIESVTTLLRLSMDVGLSIEPSAVF
jgi:hypothetical protein